MSVAEDLKTITVSVTTRVYDSRTPIAPAWAGEQYEKGVRLVAGRDYATDAVAELLRRNTPLAADIETSGATGPDLPRQLKVVTVGTSDLVVAMDPRDEYQRPVIQRILGEAKMLVFHNAAFDIPLLVGDGLADIEVVERTYCTLVLARLAHPGRVSRTLAAMAKLHLDMETGDIQDLFSAAGYKNRGQGFEHMDIDSPGYLRNAMLDTAVTARLAPVLFEAGITHLTTGHPFTGMGLDRDEAANEIERQQVVNRVMLRTSVHGFLLDPDYYDAYVASQLEAKEDAERVLRKAGVEPGRSQGTDVVACLDSRRMLPPDWPRTEKTAKPSAARDNLKRLKDDPLVAAHLTYTDIKKNLDDYLLKLRDYARFDGRVHPQVHVLGAGATGRMSAGDPPVQQFPDTARQMILADDPGGWVSIDWTAVEPMVAAYTSGELNLVHQVLSGADTYVPVARSAGLIPDDVSDEDAKEHPGRKAAKVIVLGLLYGKGVTLLATELGTDYDTAHTLKNNVLGGIPMIGRWMRELNGSAEKLGKTTTSAGRIVPVSPDLVKGGFKGYQAQNYYHQGSAYDCLADALVEIHQQGLSPHIRLAVHDELVVTAEAAVEVERIMGRATVSLSRILAAGGQEHRAYGLVLPTVLKPLPERWMKV
jgi:DNA polymerase-1